MRHILLLISEIVGRRDILVEEHHLHEVALVSQCKHASGCTDRVASTRAPIKADLADVDAQEHGLLANPLYNGDDVTRHLIAGCTGAGQSVLRVEDNGAICDGTVAARGLVVLGTATNGSAAVNIDDCHVSFRVL